MCPSGHILSLHCVNTTVYSLPSPHLESQLSNFSHAGCLNRLNRLNRLNFLKAPLVACKCLGRSSLAVTGTVVEAEAETPTTPSPTTDG